MNEIMIIETNFVIVITHKMITLVRGDHPNS